MLSFFSELLMWRVDLLAADICSYLFKLNPRFLRSYLSVCLSAIFIFQTVNMSVIKVCVCSFFFYEVCQASRLLRTQFKSQLPGALIVIYEAVEEIITYEDDEYKIYVK